MADLEKLLIKEYETTPVRELADAPVWALQGVSKKDAERLKKAFYIETIRDLSELKYLQWASDIVDMAESEGADEPQPALQDKLIKKYEQTPPAKLMRAPLKALQGVSAKDEKLLTEAFKVKTLKSLANLKYYQKARQIMALYHEEQAALLRDFPGEDESKGGCFRFRNIILLLVLLLIAWLVWKYLTGRVPAEMPGITQEPAITEEAPVVDDVRDAQENQPSTEQQPAVSREEITSSEEASTQETVPGELLDVEEEGNIYVVQSGDSLVSISEKELGHYQHWKDIYELNRQQISKPWHLYPGQKLKMPDTR